MDLFYYQGQNFGDALNPLIFDTLLPDFFDGDPGDLFIGIGSILGLVKADHRTRRKIVFSSGYAAGRPATYGPQPEIDDTFDVVCVRGPETARLLGLDPSLAVADGALLVRVLDLERPDKRYRFSYMPHVGSEDLCADWPGIAAECGYNYIPPRSPVEHVLAELMRSEVVIAEAMHGAIVADALGVPWIAARAYETVNDFKWTDYCSSLEMDYRPRHLPTYFGPEYVEKLFRAKLGRRVPGAVSRLAAATYRRRPNAVSRDQVVASMGDLAAVEPTLSRRDLVEARTDQLVGLLSDVRSRYGP